MMKKKNGQVGLRVFCQMRNEPRTGPHLSNPNIDAMTPRQKTTGTSAEIQSQNRVLEAGQTNKSPKTHSRATTERTRDRTLMIGKHTIPQSHPEMLTASIQIFFC